MHLFSIHPFKLIIPVLLLTIGYSVTGIGAPIYDALRKMNNGTEPALALCLDFNSYRKAVDAGADGPNVMSQSGDVQGFSFDELTYNDTWNSPLFATRDPSVCPSGSS